MARHGLSNATTSGVTMGSVLASWRRVAARDLSGAICVHKGTVAEFLAKCARGGLIVEDRIPAPDGPWGGPFGPHTAIAYGFAFEQVGNCVVMATPGILRRLLAGDPRVVAAVLKAEPSFDPRATEGGDRG